MNVLGSKFVLPRKGAYDKYARALDGQIHDVETYLLNPNGVDGGWVHVTLVVRADGDVSVGTAVVSPLDHFSRSRGHTIATGRALLAAVPGTHRHRRHAIQNFGGRLEPPFKTGVALRDALRPLALEAAAAAYERAEKVWIKKGLV